VATARILATFTPNATFTKPERRIVGTKDMKKRGYGVLLPVDYALLELLPDEGQMIGYKPIALQVGSIKNRPGFEEITGNQIAGRLKSMNFQGLTVTQFTLPTQGGMGWQRTAKGKEALRQNGRVAT
jgi:hypothetical protein